MVDVSDRWMCGRLDLEVLKCLSQHPDTPAILVLNKVFLDCTYQCHKPLLNVYNVY